MNNPAGARLPLKKFPIGYKLGKINAQLPPG